MDSFLKQTLSTKTNPFSTFSQRALEDIGNSVLFQKRRLLSNKSQLFNEKFIPPNRLFVRLQIMVSNLITTHKGANMSLHKICFQCSKFRAAERYYQPLWQ